MLASGEQVLVIREILARIRASVSSRGSCLSRELDGIWSPYIQVALAGSLQGSPWQVLWFAQA